MTKDTGESRALLERGFHFITVLWGERYRDYFLEYCLPSLLSPGNIPALRTRGACKFLIATRPTDWELMRATAIFKLLEGYITPVFFEIPPCPSGRSGCEHMGIGHKACCEQAFREKAYAMILPPDSIVSDGTVVRLQELALDGAQLVLAGAIRYGEEPFLSELQTKGAIPAESRRDSGKPLVIDARTMASAALKGLHSESLRYEWDAPYFNAQLPSAVWWRVPDEDGIVVHSLSWALLLLDYRAVRKHDTSALDEWTIDGDYLYRNFGTSPSVQVIDDSDHAFLASFSPVADGMRALNPNRLFQLPYLGDLLKKSIFHDAFSRRTFDPLKRRIFCRPLYWHSRPLNDKWEAVELKACGVLSAALQKPNGAVRRFALSTLRLPLRMGIIVGQFWTYRKSARRRIYEIIGGDAAAAKRVVSRLTEYGTFLIGRARY
jgi:hypothetical protein